jgi:hypothetical protein
VTTHKTCEKLFCKLKENNMNTFVNNINNQEVKTSNGMKALNSTSSMCVDLFFNIGASRGKDIVPGFLAAYNENPDYALRIAQWVRDVRQGAGERKIFRDILLETERKDPDAAIALLNNVPELGRWDDLLIDFKNPAVKKYAFNMIKDALASGNGLAAKWMPRKGPKAAELRLFLGWTPKQYRKTLVNLTKVVETHMCAKDWDNINFNHVPSVAGARYKKAFNRHTPKYAEWAAKLISTDPEVSASVKVNAGAVYPHDVLKGFNRYYTPSDAKLNNIQGQWDALPNFMGEGVNVMPISDVSGSMECSIDGSSSTSCLDVSVALGLYVADKNKGAFKDVFMTFSSTPKIQRLKGNIIDKIQQISSADWGMSTDLHAAFTVILKLAVDNDVTPADMPKILLIMSDMQFNECTTHNDSAIEMIHRKYEAAGYEVPQIVFWNLHSTDNVPVKMNSKKVALVSGFSPSILKSVLNANMEEFTPEGIMLKTIMSDRYNY